MSSSLPWPLIKSLVKYHLVGRMPEGITRRLRKWDSQRTAKAKRTRRSQAVASFGTFGRDELTTVLRQRGVQEGGVVFAQCSWGDLDTFAGNALDVVEALRATVGPAGTLLMPAYTLNSTEVPPRTFVVDAEPTYTGMVHEVYRRSEGVQRSLHPRHSICGAGPLSKELLAGHERCVRADGPDSPFDRLRQLDAAWIVTLGLPTGFFSFLHWVEDFDPAKLPFRVHKTAPVECELRLPDGRNISVLDWHVRRDVAARVDFAHIAKHLTEQAMTYGSHKGVPVGVYPIKPLAQELLALRDRGILHYR